LIGGYNQYNQEILDDDSKLYKFKPDIIFLFIDTKTLLGDLYFDYHTRSQNEVNALLESILCTIKKLLSKLIKKLKCKIVVHNFEVPTRSPLGIIDNKEELGFIEFVKKLNSELNDFCKNKTGVFVFDYDLFCSRHGKENILDWKMYYLGDIKIGFKYLPYLCDEYLSYVKPLCSLSKKCLVLDLDNTLWGGIIGEEGLEGIQLGPDKNGKPFYEFQKYILALFKRGIILAVNSKNNPDDVMKVLREHPYMVLKEEHFASLQVNWDDKITNMKRIAEELNIGLDSMVFFDDDPLNREMIRKSLPMVEVVEMPEDTSLYLKTIMDLNSFNSFQFSVEDKNKGRMYAEQRKRKELSSKTIDITEYLRELKMVATIQKPTGFTIPRIAQLTQKTNQFNMTTKRYSEEDIKQFLNDEHLVFSVSVKDKFGDNGIVGVSIVDKYNWMIDTFLLSCRVIGRKIEKVMMSYILEEAIRHKAKSVMGVYIPTVKNIPAKSFYEDMGFKPIEKNKYIYHIDKGYTYPSFIEVHYG